MPGLDGFAVIKKLLDKKIRLPQFVFATAFDQYAVRAFEVNAVDYLLKPFDRARVDKTIEKARSRVSDRMGGRTGEQGSARGNGGVKRFSSVHVNCIVSNLRRRPRSMACAEPVKLV